MKKRAKKLKLKLGLILIVVLGLLGVTVFVLSSEMVSFDTSSEAATNTGEVVRKVFIGSRSSILSDLSFREFLSTETSPTYVVGESTLGQVRRWIGHSDCSSCTPGIPKSQKIKFNDVKPYSEYTIIIYPAKFPSLPTSNVTFKSRITSGTASIVSGATKLYTTDSKRFNIADGPWNIVISPSTASFTIEFYNEYSSGTHYMYIDAYEVRIKELDEIGLAAKKYIDYALSKSDTYYLNYYKNFTGKPYEMGGMSLACSTFLSGYKKYNTPELKRRAELIGDFLVANKDRNENGVVGWGFDATSDPFQDGTVNPAKTEYIFQTARVINCLSELYEVSGKKVYKDVVVEAIDDSWLMGKSTFSSCTDCFYYWYSYNKNDFNRYVRNTNLQMAQALSYAYHSTGISKYKTRAQQVLNAEMNEVNKGNQGYFGIYDKEYSSVEKYRTENHYPLLAIYLYDITRLLELNTYDQKIIGYMNTWKNCTSGFCLANDCNIWAGNIELCTNTQTHYYCYVRTVSTEFKNNCVHEIQEGSTTSLMYSWSILRGFPSSL